MIKLKVLMLGFVFLLFCNFAFAVSDLIAFQGNVKEGGSNLALGDLRVYIYDSAVAGNLIYDSLNDFNSAVVDGKYDVMLGTGVELNLDYGKLYYFDMEINGENFNFNGDDRQIFQAGVGTITLDKIEFADKLVLTNQSVVFDNNVNVSVSSGGWFKGWFDWVVDSLSLNWLSFDGQTLKFNETHLNLTIDSRASRYNETEWVLAQNYLTSESDPLFIAENSTIWSAINSKLSTSDQRFNETTLILNVNGSLWSYIGANEGGWLSTYNATYDLYSYNHTAVVMDWIQLQEGISMDSNARLSSLNVTNVLRVGSTTLYADTSGLNISGVVNFNGGWTDNGVSVIDGDVFAQRLYVYNITSLAVTDLNVNGSIIPQIGSSFDIGSADRKYRDLYLSGTGNFNSIKSIDWSNVTISESQISDLSSITSESDPIFVAENSTIWSAINSKLDLTDQRYNNTAIILDINGSLWSYIGANEGGWLSTYNSTYATWAYNQTAPAINYFNNTINNLDSGKVLFGNLEQDTNLHWDNTNKRLGIGTTQPQSTLELSETNDGNVVIPLTIRNSAIGTGTGSGIRFLQSAALTGDAYVDIEAIRTNSPSSGDVDLAFNFRGNEKFRFLRDGRFGMGTNDPVGLFHIKEDNGDRKVFINLGGKDDITAGYGSFIRFSSSNENFPTHGSMIGGIREGSGGTNALLFYTGAPTPSERMRITNAGNVGIGTTTPTHTLNVVGTVNITGNTIVGGNLNATGDICIIGGNCLSSVSGGGISGTIASGQVSFGTGADTLGGDSNLTWDNTNKRLGIGTASPANSLDVASLSSNDGIRLVATDGSNMRWSYSSLRNFEFTLSSTNDYQTTFVNSASGFHNLRVDGRIYNTGANNGISFQKGSGYRFWIDDREVSESLVFSTGTTPGSTTDNILSVSRLGRVGIGTTTPTQPLHVVGNVNVSDDSKLYLSADTSRAPLNLPRYGTSDPTSTESGDIWYRSNNLWYNDQGNIRAVAHTGSWALITEAAIDAGTETTSRFISGARLQYALNTKAVLQTGDQTVAGLKTFSTAPRISQATAVLNFTSTTGVKTIATAGTTDLALMPGGTGRVGIGTTTPTQKLDVAGNINMSSGSKFTTGRGEIYWDSSGNRLVIRVS